MFGFMVVFITFSNLFWMAVQLTFSKSSGFEEALRTVIKPKFILPGFMTVLGTSSKPTGLPIVAREGSRADLTVI